GSAAWICGDKKRTPQAERQRILSGFKDGQIQYVVNCQILTEGVDIPSTSCVVMARPTGSRSLYCQCLGRGVRTLPGVVSHDMTPEQRVAAIAASAKPDLLVIDLWCNSDRHKLVSVADVLGGQEVERVVDLARRAAR